MRFILIVLLWFILFALCWPLALMLVIILPLLWLILLPFRIVGLTIELVFRLIRAVLMFPFQVVAGSK